MPVPFRHLAIALLHRISPSLKAGAFGFVIVVNLGLLICLGFPGCCFLLLTLLLLFRSSANSTCPRPDRGSLAGITRYSPDTGTDQCAAGSPPKRSAFRCWFLLRDLLGPGRIKTGLLHCPLVTFIFVLLLLLRGLVLGGIDNHPTVCPVESCA